MTRPLDPEIFKRQARGENVGHPRLLPVRAMRTVRYRSDRSLRQVEVSCRRLTLIISGTVRIQAGDGGRLLRAGDIFLMEEMRHQSVGIDLTGDCRIVHLDVPEWAPSGEPLCESERRDSIRESQVISMYRTSDDQSSFRSFDHLFPGEDGAESESHFPTGFHFVGFPDRFFIDWHPEGVNNFVFLLRGALELEVGAGAERVKTFRAGDVCLAEDRTGFGHIDRAHGVTELALIVFDDSQLWPATQ